METILKEFTSYGFPGLIIAALLFWIWQKDRELKAERDARVADAKAFSEQIVAYQEKHMTGISHLATTAENMREATEQMRDAALRGTRR